MKKIIVAIGGGENGRILDDGTKAPYDTELIDKEIVKLTKKANPNFLFICHAMNFSEKIEKSYFETMKKIYGDKFKCNCDILQSNELGNKNIVNKKISWADIIYEGGGDTESMIRLWKKTKFDAVLKNAWENGKIICGISAGAVCWFDSCISELSNGKYSNLQCLGWINAHITPHCNESERRKFAKKYLESSAKKGILLSNCSAIEIINDKYKILLSSEKAYCVKASWKNKKYIQRKLCNTKMFKSILNILNNMSRKE